MRFRLHHHRISESGLPYNMEHGLRIFYIIFLYIWRVRYGAVCYNRHIDELSKGIALVGITYYAEG